MIVTARISDYTIAMVCGLRESLVDLGRDSSEYERLSSLDHIWVKTCFFPLLYSTYTPNNLYPTSYHENNVQSPIRTYPIIALHENSAIFHELELYSTNQIPFCQIRLRSISCHFHVNRVHWKNFTCYQMLLIVDFHTILPRFDFFCEYNWPLATSDLIQSQQQPAFDHIFHTQREKST